MIKQHYLSLIILKILKTKFNNLLIKISKIIKILYIRIFHFLNQNNIDRKVVLNMRQILLYIKIK